MALFHRVRVLTATTGTGNLTLMPTGVRSAVDGDCFAPAEVISSVFGRIFPYWIISGNSFGYGNGSVTSNGLTLIRDIYEKSWNGVIDSVTPLSLTGTSIVFISPRAADFGAGRRGRSLALARGFITI